MYQKFASYLNISKGNTLSSFHVLGKNFVYYFMKAKRVSNLYKLALGY